MKRASSVDEYVTGTEHWKEELNTLRRILRSCKLEETIKWGAPCYVLNGKNIVGLGAYRAYVGLWFHQGALLSDPEGVLINAQEGKTRALRQWRFTDKSQIKTRLIKSYVREAMDLHKQGKEIKPDRHKKLSLPAELTAALSVNAQAKRAFAALTPGKRREYADHIAEAKRHTTRLSRTDKALPMILAGQGLHDRYRE